jgi:alginate O-acetyltransferase complex protein AlgJ
MNKTTAHSGVATRRTEAPLSREGEAARDLGGTSFAAGARAALITGFLVLLAVGFGAACAGLSGVFKKPTGASEVRASCTASGKALGASSSASASLLQWFPSPEATRALEKTLVESSVLVDRLRPWVQSLMVEYFGQGNSQAVVARDGWLFFRKDLDYVNGRPFLDPDRQRERMAGGGVSADPLPAILDFQSQLAERGIRLVLLPVPVKPCIEGDRFTRDSGGARRVRQNASFEASLEALRGRGVEVFDPAPLLFERREQTGEAQYLARDTHWTPKAMEAVAQALARLVEAAAGGSRPSSSRGGSGAPVLEERMVAALGDTVALLGLPEQQTLFSPETVTIRAVSSRGAFWTSNPGADVLLLGDSFSNIFSFREMGWGEHAGLAEHLGAALGQPVDALLRNSDGAFATRQMLQHELARGRDRLAGKKVVVWEFAVRELALGDWKSVPLKLGAGLSPSFYCPPAGRRARVEGTVARLSAVPRPGSAPYREHVMSVLLVDVAVDNGPVEPGRQCLVYTWSMRDQKPARGASLRPGERVEWELAAWEDVQETREKFQRSEFEDPMLLLEPFAWWE